ncbi:ABC transporter substrate-binding protein [Streptomyces albus]|uniref:ABC transporter substrate-binding protein n=1 Tax=Streptomyces albus TaxID=1888 RepID=A0A8H1QUH3_9ACTN|nr:ABC transporter substrate-binding protein [Streptomyces albus]TGG86297.1 ABC transporter substrate-binding protein [Streptomyces albus]UVN53366.1 ABC transporter substrate-binding protein [Streptomyces albus]
MAGATTQVCIGVVAPLTGRLAPLGEPLSFAVRALAPRLARLHNGGRAYDVRVAVRDSRSDPQTARQAVAELAVRDRARIILTMAGTQVLPAATDACERLSVPCVSTTFPWQAYGYARGGDPLRAFRWTYHFAWGLDDIADVFADVWERIGERQTVGCLWNDDLQGRLLRHGRYGFVPVASGRGHCLVDPGGYAESAPEFDAHVARFREQDARIVTSAATAEDLARYYGRARAAGFIPRLITCSRWLTYPHTHTSTSADVHAALAAARVATLVYWSPAHPYRSGLDGSTCADLARAYREATGRGWLQPLGLAHALFEVARHALTTAPDPTDRAAIAHTLGKTRTETVVGPLDWTRGPTPNVALLPLAAGQWQQSDDGPRLAVVDSTRVPGLPVTADLVTAF